LGTAQVDTQLGKSYLIDDPRGHYASAEPILTKVLSLAPNNAWAHPPPSLDCSRLLCEFILPAAYDAKRGTYIPLTHKVGLFPGTVAYRSKRIAKKFLAIGTDIVRAPMNPCFFANGLSIPEAFGTPFFDTLSAPLPKDRVANIGFIVTTLEFDCRTPAEFLDVVCLIPLNNEFHDGSPLYVLDAQLHELPEYRGCCVVFSGRSSIHFHFVFSTQHLRAAPFDADRSLFSPLERKSEACFMHRVHQLYWDYVASQFAMSCPLTLGPDRSLRMITQYRRLPWALRILEADSDVLNLSEGTPVVQMVLFEAIKPSTGGTSGHLVAPDFSLDAASDNRPFAHWHTGASDIVQRPIQAPSVVPPTVRACGAFFFIVKNHNHANIFAPVVKLLENQNAFCTFVDMSADMESVTVGGNTVIGLPQLPRSAVPGDVIVVPVDWGPQPLVEFLSSCPLRGLLRVGIVEGCLWNVAGKYRNVDHLLAWGPSGARESRCASVHIVGSPIVESAVRTSPDFDEPPFILINYKFVHRWNLGRERWLGGVLSACDALGVRVVISRHPADNFPAEAGTFSDRSVTDLLRGASAVVTRPSTVIFEAMAARKPVVVFPTHGEPLGEFAKPIRAFQIVHSEAELGPAIERALRGKKECWSRCREFFDDHVSIEIGKPAADRIVERLLAFQRALRRGDDHTVVLPYRPTGATQGQDSVYEPAAPLCPSCGLRAELVDGSRLYLRAETHRRKFWVCQPCDSRVGCHEGTSIPLGALADPTLRKARQRAHAAFDSIWTARARQKGLSRKQARQAGYRWLADQLGIDPAVCHIGMMSSESCARVVAVCSGMHADQ
jgi:hypothetical protein